MLEVGTTEVRYLNGCFCLRKVILIRMVPGTEIYVFCKAAGIRHEALSGMRSGELG